jgi:hypothetical protein
VVVNISRLAHAVTTPVAALAEEKSAALMLEFGREWRNAARHAAISIPLINPFSA